MITYELQIKLLLNGNFDVTRNCLSMNIDTTIFQYRLESSRPLPEVSSAAELRFLPFQTEWVCLLLFSTDDWCSLGLQNNCTWYAQRELVSRRNPVPLGLAGRLSLDTTLCDDGNAHVPNVTVILLVTSVLSLEFKAINFFLFPLKGELFPTKFRKEKNRAT